MKTSKDVNNLGYAVHLVSAEAETMEKSDQPLPLFGTDVLTDLLARYQLFLTTQIETDKDNRLCVTLTLTHEPSSEYAQYTVGYDVPRTYTEYTQQVERSKVEAFQRLLTELYMKVGSRYEI